MGSSDRFHYFKIFFDDGHVMARKRLLSIENVEQH